MVVIGFTGFGAESLNWIFRINNVVRERKKVTLTLFKRVSVRKTLITVKFFNIEYVKLLNDFECFYLSWESFSKKNEENTYILGLKAMHF